MEFKTGTEIIVINLTESLKLRIKQYVKQVFGLKMVPSNKKLKELFPKYSDLRKCINWMHIMKATEIKEENNIMMETKNKVSDNADKLDNAIFTATRTGLISRGKNDTFMGYSWELYETDRNGGRTLIGTVGYSTNRDTFYFNRGRCGVAQHVATAEKAVNDLLILCSRKYRNYATAA